MWCVCLHTSHVPEGQAEEASCFLVHHHMTAWHNLDGGSIRGNSVILTWPLPMWELVPPLGRWWVVLFPGTHTWHNSEIWSILLNSLTKPLSCRWIDIKNGVFSAHVRYEERSACSRVEEQCGYSEVSTISLKPSICQKCHESSTNFYPETVWVAKNSLCVLFEQFQHSSGVPFLCNPEFFCSNSHNLGGWVGRRVLYTST